MSCQSLVVMTRVFVFSENSRSFACANYDAAHTFSYKRIVAKSTTFSWEGLQPVSFAGVILKHYAMLLMATCDCWIKKKWKFSGNLTLP